MKVVFILFSVVLLLNLDTVFSKSVQIEFEGSLANEEHHRFFQSLQKDEQEWIMKLAAWYYNINDFSALPHPTGDSEAQPKVRFALPLLANDTDTTPDVPDKLIAHFLNGDVPKYWQRQFTNWLRQDFNIKDKNFDQFRDTGIFCYPEDPCDLIDLSNIGGSCCPFG